MADTLKLEISVDDKGSTVVKNFRDTVNQANAEVTASAGKTGSAADGLWNQFALGAFAAEALAQGISMISGAIKESITSYLDAEERGVKFEFAMRNIAVATSEQIAVFVQRAKTLQAMTGIDDDEIKSLMQLGVQYGVTTQQIGYATTASIALSEAYGIDTNRAMKMVSQALEGNYDLFVRTLPQLKGMTDEAAKGEIVFKALSNSINLVSEKTETAAVKWKVFQAGLNDVKEAFGGFVVESVRGWGMIFAAMDPMSELKEKMLAKIKAEEAALMAKTGKELKQIADVKAAETKKTESELANDKLLADAKAADAKIDQEMRAKENQAFYNAQENAKKKLLALKEHTRALEEAAKKYEEKNKYQQWAIELDEIEKNKLAMLAGQQDDLNASMKLAAAANEEDLKKEIALRDQDIARIEAQQEALRGLIGIGNTVIGALEQLGIISGETASQVNQILGDTESFLTNLASGNVLGAIAAGINLIGDAIEAIGNLFAGDGVGEAIGRLQTVNDLTAEQEQAIRDLADAAGGAENAYAMLLARFIDEGDVTGDNINDWAAQIENIFANIAYAGMSPSDAADAMSDSFDSLITKARDLGAEGSKGLVQLITHVRDSGLEVASINKYIEEMNTKALIGYRALQEQMAKDKDLKAVFGGISVPALDELLATEKKVAANQELVNAIKNTKEVLDGLSATTELSADQFAMFETTSKKAFDQLKNKGFSDKESLLQMAPMLAKLLFLSKEYGYKLDPATQAMIDLAKANGVKVEDIKSDSELMKDSLGEQVKIGENTKSVADKMGQMVSLWKEYMGAGSDDNANNGNNGNNAMSAAAVARSNVKNNQVTVVQIFPRGLGDADIADALKRIGIGNTNGVMTAWRQAVGNG